MRPYAQRFLESVVSPRATTSRDRVKELMEFLLPLGKCTMDHIARTLGVDRRTLHRHLADEGESFSSLLHSTRAGLAEHYLANDRYSMTDICQLLGLHRPERLLPVVPPAVRDESERLALDEPHLTLRPAPGTLHSSTTPGVDRFPRTPALQGVASPAQAQPAPTSRRRAGS